VTAIFAVVHYWWLVKADVRKPEQYAVALGVLLAYRVFVWISERRKQTLSAATAQKISEA
jgi:sulfoxide reductase heme-binding subunit YedZ